MEQVTKDEKRDEHACHKNGLIFREKRLVARPHETHIFEALDKDKIKYGRQGNASKNTNKVSNILLVAKGENQARHILHRKANYKSDGHRKENAQNHRQSLRGVDEVSQFQGIVRKNLDTGDSHRGAQKFKDH